MTTDYKMWINYDNDQKRYCMEIFGNRWRPNYDEIVSYGPRWLTEYREMDANYRYAGWTLDLMACWLERIVNNDFPAYADEETIGMWERGSP